MCVEAVREKCLLEEIADLEKYNVPKEVIERMRRKALEIEEWEKHRLDERERANREWAEKDRNSQAVINALGAHLVHISPMIDRRY